MSFTRRNLLLLAATIGIAAGPATAHAADVLNVGAYPTNPPFEYKNESGTFEGFEVDIVNEAAKRAGMTTEIADLGFQALFAATESVPETSTPSNSTPHPAPPQLFSDHPWSANSSTAFTGVPDGTPVRLKLSTIRIEALRPPSEAHERDMFAWVRSNCACAILRRV